MANVGRAVQRAILAGALLLPACAVTLLSQYDERTDALTSALQEASTAHFESLGSATLPACLHENHMNYYRDARVDLSALALRVRSIPKNQPTIEQVDGLTRSFAQLEELHRIDSRKPECLSPAELRPLQSAFDQQFRAIMTLEIAKKRGGGE